METKKIANQKKVLTVRITAEIHRRLKYLALERGLPMNTIVATLIESCVEEK